MVPGEVEPRMVPGGFELGMEHAEMEPGGFELGRIWLWGGMGLGLFKQSQMTL